MLAALSIIIPALNEAAQLPATLAALQALHSRGVEIIVVDGGSHDDTVRLARPCVDRVLTSPPGRARQMNAGAAQAQGTALLFLHADTLLPANADQLALAALAHGGLWGRFDVTIQGQPFMLKVVARAMNWRSRLTGIATGDQALFVRRAVFEQLGGFPDQPLMEDIELCRRLSQIAPPCCLRARVTTSGRRWESRGVWRTIVLMWHLRFRYWRGESAHQLAKAYR